MRLRPARARDRHRDSGHDARSRARNGRHRRRRADAVGHRGPFASADVVEREGIRARARRAWRARMSCCSSPRRSDTTLALLATWRPAATLHRQCATRSTSPASRHGSRTKTTSTSNLRLKTGAGLELLRCRTRRALAGGDVDPRHCTARARHVRGARTRANARRHSKIGTESNATPAEPAAEELREVGRALGEITATPPARTCLGAIFSWFCIGK